MRKAWLAIRSVVLWTIAGIHFFFVGLGVVLAGLILDRRKHDWINRGFFRNIMRLTAVKFEVCRSPGFDPARTSIFICNHVNIFDPFVIYSAIPQFVRGFELESHFKVPIYGWIMGWFGNVAVPDAPTREGLEIMTQRAQAALDADISLIAFAEGSRTRDGRVHEFKKGIFNLAQKFGVPIVPMSIVGSYQFFQTGNWMLYPGKITVILHDTIETVNIPRGKIDELRQRVQDIVSAPIDESLKANPVERRSVGPM
jgi:1-acyl-sn-glycerol-3-phosphate acyltransferase